MEDKPVDETVWVTVTQAARRLGVTTTAIRRRIKRRTLEIKQGNRGILVRLPLTGRLGEREAEPVSQPSGEPSRVPFSERFHVNALEADLEAARKQLIERDRQIATQAAEIAALKAERDGLVARLGDRDKQLDQNRADHVAEIVRLTNIIERRDCEAERMQVLLQTEQQQVKALTDQREESESPPRRSWWRWRHGKR